MDSAPGDAPAAIGGRLDPATVLAGYRHGVFPMPVVSAAEAEVNHFLYEDSVAAGTTAVLDSPLPDPFALTWWSPDPRPVIPYGRLAKPRSLMKLLRNRLRWTTTANQHFDRVLAECRANRTPEWLTDELCECMVELHKLGWAHSVEVWDGDELVGGAAGIGVGTVFTLDTCFHRQTNASKVALLDMECRLAGTGVTLLDVEWDSEQSRRLNAGPVPRREFLAALSRGGDPVPLAGGVEEVRRLGFLRTPAE
ncbi:leucyl/phenylalanyl-tRNA--protein transferase [Actinoplanes ianthinogenes]|uniref:Leucyl/phenylalanyl-tRNA--protein transferase n=1 Tax=Actinoplanes ianthinogenes TaxID=122358 RepID=A0ABN6CHB2_9ACTN|nr:leucyl/phenylalanyl-tRNA--protein transferase [Actinoplanes ianthinogenes]BCJ44518.1 leucyl/phenylalanyl-tRNA--protein transferase [Actinoplanes ianthinogenes]GGQ98475.1 leucyl/phenylalanyl-tRNA--protein transferase [Actinoplanes ianthinogenes]